MKCSYRGIHFKFDILLLSASIILNI